MPTAVSRTTSVSANVGYTVPFFFDEFVATSNVEEMLVGSGISQSIRSSFITSSSANVGYTVPFFFDQFVTTSNVEEMIIGTTTAPLVQTSKVPLANLAFENVPSATYVVTDGQPILLVSVFNTQYWSAS